MRIVIPTDFSPSARSAARYAYDLFGPDCEYLLLHAYQTPHAGASVLVSLNDIMREEAEDSLRQEVEQLYKLFGADINLKKDAIYGEVSAVIHQVTETQPVDFVVMGTIGASGIKEVFLGSNSASSIRQCRVPLIVVPSSWTRTEFDNVLLAIDNKSYSPGIFEPVRTLGKPGRTVIHLLHVEETDEDVNFSGVLKHFEDFDCRIHKVEGSNISKSILEYLEENEIDLLTLVNRKHSFWSRLFKRSNTAKVAMHTQVPLLALHDV